MKKIKQIIFLCVFIAGMAFTPNSTVEASMAPKTDKFWVLVNLTQYFGSGGEYTYNDPNTTLTVEIRNINGTEIHSAVPGFEIRTQLPDTGYETVTVTVEGSNSYVATQTFIFDYPVQYATINMVIPAINPE